MVNKQNNQGASLENKFAVPKLINNKELQFIIAIVSIISISIMVVFAITNTITPNWVAAILFIPLIILPFTSLIRKIIWTIPRFIILLISFWPLSIVYLIQKRNRQNKSIHQSFLYSFFPWFWSLVIEWGIIIFGSIIILLGLFITTK
ncbi:hypothetical protein COV53_02320 [Candidatus Gottesmanbacteria bacterium CG11_big_fil_rev_8_21_14_0_20_37_11]|uniref:Uncharacterized protein n=2 Tax=Candidatus Gottesmaniibacteriota TaxID=1752720 RepID=A0A2M7RT77_9BACT|nr:MAG: hypothetical protein COX23_03500 [Candidatus Gottesmanbacteria bacterium CG23_combo_of_CG06-09_8_20_14_all_37_19]PIR08569.1 MAG: hypothetical protein COV53_02320 [Candidatus Gottesmanbacteria bacterium CG11_big_fil_rev_8_21_14_0_20_37_11]PIZ03249.1 MAG: hypothetical protein COY59_00495 [Candidatus Gottesmanbacteria bacterium CG_4_10_14_0_8_um_filter_37_24]